MPGPPWDSSPPPSRPPLSHLNPDPYAPTSPSTTTMISGLANAPTPFNTYSDSHIYSTTSQGDFANEEEYMRDVNPDISIQPSLHLDDPSLSSSSPSRVHSNYSANTSTHLLSSTYSNDSIPHSTRPVPAPPLSLRFHSDTSEPLATPNTIFSSSSNTDGSLKPTGSSADIESSTSSGSHLRKPLRQEDVDAQRLQQLGYDPVLGRDYTFWSSASISTVNIGCLQGVIYAVSGAYNYGGPLMILVAWPFSGIFSMFLTLTLSELASAYPVAGAMASWTWKLARGGVGGERGWAWLMGGVVLGGHLGNVLLVTWEICNIIAGTMELSFNYEKQSWHLLCFFLAILLICGLTGSTGWGRSHRFWLGCGVYFLAVWLIVNISLLTTVAKNPNRHISTDFFNNTGWSSRAYVSILGWQYTTIASGADASAHMAEETQRPARNVPNAMVASMVVTYVLGYISIILLLLAIPSDGAASIARHPFPFGHILETAINLPGAIALLCLLIILLTFQVLAQLQASSRFVFAMARDNGAPFSDYITWTNSSKQPVIANWIVVAMCAPFSLLTIAGQNTLYSVLAVTASSLSYWGYLVPVVLYLLSKKDLQTEGRTSWSLRKFSKPFACIGLVFCVLVIVAQMFPGRRPTTAESISWSPVVLVGTALICFVTWRLYGSKHYSGPIRALTKWETGVEIDLQSALASSRSRPSHNGNSSNDNDEQRRRPGSRQRGQSDDIGQLSSIKLDLETATGHDLTHTVSVTSARTLDSGHIPSQWTQWSGTGSEWTDGTASSSSGSSGSGSTARGGQSHTASRNMSPGVGRISEEDEVDRR